MLSAITKRMAAAVAIRCLSEVLFMAFLRNFLILLAMRLGCRTNWRPFFMPRRLARVVASYSRFESERIALAGR